MAGVISLDHKGVAVAAVAVVGLYFLAKSEAGKVAEALDPTDHDNAANTAFNKIYGAVTDGKGTLGTDAADFVQSLRFWEANP